MTELDAHAVKIPKLPDPRRLQPETVRWWKAWVGSEQAEMLRAVDWEALLRLVPVVDEFWRTREAKLLPEIRLVEASLGGSPDARMRLRWKIKAADVPDNVRRMGRADPRLEAVKGEAG